MPGGCRRRPGVPATAVAVARFPGRRGPSAERGDTERRVNRNDPKLKLPKARTRSTPVAVGARLRAVRRQKRLSLQAVEKASRLEFKASVLGAYERGERTISVPRLQRLAQLYRVPVDQLLPPELGETPVSRTRPGLAATASGPIPTASRSRSSSTCCASPRCRAQSESSCGASSPLCRCSARTSTARCSRSAPRTSVSWPRCSARASRPC